MKADKIMNAIGNVDDRYITEAMEYKVKKKPIWLLKAAVAACLCIAILGGGLAFTAVAKERDYYKSKVTSVGLIDQGDNPAQIAKTHAERMDSLTSTKGYVLTVTTDKTNYTVDEYIYVTARIENISDVELVFDAINGRYGIFMVSSYSAEYAQTKLYDASYNRYDIDSNSFAKDENQEIALKPGEYFSQTFCFSAKYISKEPDRRPVEADEVLPYGMYVISIQTRSARCGLTDIRIPVVLSEET